MSMEQIWNVSRLENSDGTNFVDGGISFNQEAYCDDGSDHKLTQAPYWCESCNQAICAGCVLDKHQVSNGHKLIGYQAAVRKENKSMDVTVTRICEEKNRMVAFQRKTAALKKEISAKLDERIAKVEQVERESLELCLTLVNHLDGMKKLAAEPLTGKTVWQRRHAADNMKNACVELLGRSDWIISKLRISAEAMDDILNVPDKKEAGDSVNELVNSSKTSSMDGLNELLEEAGDNFPAMA